VTVNDYLAKRDCQWMRPLFNFLGLSVGYIISGISDEARKKAYQCDITYATNNELGFDYLRDNMKFSLDARAQRPFHYAIIDEVDSILIDEARTPLIISGPVNNRSDLYVEIDKFVRQLTPNEYEKEEKTRSVNLNENGICKLEEQMIQNGLIKEGSAIYDVQNTHLVHFINQALKAHVMFHNNVEYLVQNGKLMIIDEFTGRVMEGRRYSDGLHQALEAKEGLVVQNENQTLASITFQNYFRLYPKLCGMTGTAMTEAAEFKFIYNLDVVEIPPHKIISRIDSDDEIYGSRAEKHQAILALVRKAHEKGQPVLIGTVSIEKSEEISKMFSQNNIVHKVLNAKYHEQEALIISQAGRKGAVTIATNMAGRGTDIMLGGNAQMLLESMNITDEQEGQTALAKLNEQVAAEKELVLAAGGLLVIGTERHESRRIDNQLRGRSGRQGDPGQTKFFLSLEDDLMRIFASEKTTMLLRSLGLKGGEAIHHPMISKALQKAQQKVESNNYEMRKTVLKFDDIMNEQRKIIYAHRHDITCAQNILDTVLQSSKDWIASIVAALLSQEEDRQDWQLEKLQKDAEKTLNIKIDIDQIEEQNLSQKDIETLLASKAEKLFLAKQEELGSELFSSAVKYVVLSLLDQMWKEHLHSLDHLRQGISLRAYGQKDPLNEYKNEALALFATMLQNFADNMVAMVAHLQVQKQVDVEKIVQEKELEQQKLETRSDPAFDNNTTVVEAKLQAFKAYVEPQNRQANNPESWGKILRNELCPCASGKKYKHCHGAVN
jgi:preprotein translocase subunit SecA